MRALKPPINNYMQEKLSIAIVQSDLIWKDKVANLANLTKHIDSIQENTDIILLPEMFTTAFCVDDPELAEGFDGQTLQWMQEMARAKDSAICGSILFKEEHRYYNRLLFVEPSGTVHHYDKHHLFSLVGEQILLTKGKHKTLIEYKGCKIQPFICYDIRFPAWCQNDDNADILIFVANWPQKRIHHWKLLLQARAAENQCYVAGVNRLGFDFHGNAHNGQSAVIDFTGNVICDAGDNAGTEIVRLSKEKLETHRKRYPFWKDR